MMNMSRIGNSKTESCEKTIDRTALIQTAMEQLNKAYAPYSHYHVGAALLGDDGKIYTGCNVENSSYGATNCAERTAVFKAVSEGCRHFRAIVIVGGPKGVIDDYAPPCGICRQVLAEFSDPKEFLVILAKSPEEWKEYTLAELLPLNFAL